MRYILMCKDKAGALEIRKANREDHLAYVKETGAVAIGGPLVDEDGNMCGSLLALNVETKAEAEAWAANDPYAKAGLFDSVDISAWNWLIGAP